MKKIVSISFVIIAAVALTININVSNKPNADLLENAKAFAAPIKIPCKSTNGVCKYEVQTVDGETYTATAYLEQAPKKEIIAEIEL